MYMLVSELRKIITKYNNDEKDKIIVELYKRIPKNIKEEYDIDKFITTLDNKKPKETKVLSIEELEKEINYFIDCANKGLYECPNKIISKKERSNWRFKVRNYYKLLNQFLPDTPEGNKATELLTKIFKVVSLGSCYLTFSNWETFRAIQVSQEEFIQNIIRRKLEEGINKENISYCVELLTVEYDPYGYYRAVLIAFENCMKTEEMKRIAITLLKEQVIKYRSKALELKKSKKSDYRAREYIRYFIECIVDLYFYLGEVDNGINYFHKNFTETTKEVKEYILLELIENFELYDEWIKEYEKHIGKIDYRDSLKEKYNKLKNK